MLDYNMHERVLILEGEHAGRYGLVEGPHLTDPYALYILPDGSEDVVLLSSLHFLSVDPRGKRPYVAEQKRRDFAATGRYEDILQRDPYDEAVVKVPRAFLERILEEGYTEQDELEVMALLAKGARRDDLKEGTINLALADTIRGTLQTAPQSYVRDYCIEELDALLAPIDEEVAAQAGPGRGDRPQPKDRGE